MSRYITIKADTSYKQIDTIQYSDKIHSQISFKVNTILCSTRIFNRNFIQVALQTYKVQLQSANRQKEKYTL